jgi:hypothetical protein
MDYFYCNSQIAKNIITHWGGVVQSWGCLQGGTEGGEKNRRSPRRKGAKKVKGQGGVGSGHLDFSDQVRLQSAAARWMKEFQGCTKIQYAKKPAVGERVFEFGEIS